MKKEASIDKFNKEHKVKGFIAYDTGSLRFYVDDDLAFDSSVEIAVNMSERPCLKAKKQMCIFDFGRV